MAVHVPGGISNRVYTFWVPVYFLIGVACCSLTGQLYMQVSLTQKPLTSSFHFRIFLQGWRDDEL